MGKDVCSKCPKCRSTCEYQVSPQLYNEESGIYSYQITTKDFYIQGLNEDKNEQTVPAWFEVISASSIKIKYKFTDQSLEKDTIKFTIPMVNISSKTCRIIGDIELPVQYTRVKPNLGKVSLETVKTIVSSVRSISILAQTKTNLTFMAIDFLNKNKLIGYLLIYSPKYTGLMGELNNFGKLGNYQKQNALVTFVLGLDSIEKSKEFKKSNVNAGFHMKENFVSEVQVVSINQIIFVLFFVMLWVNFYFFYDFFDYIMSEMPKIKNQQEELKK
jgi:hypothetical protein